MDMNRYHDPSPATQSPPKFLRYRSVRKASSQDGGLDATPAAPPPPSQAPGTGTAALTRLPSRYHRKSRPADASSPDPSPSWPHDVASQPSKQRTDTARPRSPRPREQRHVPPEVATSRKIILGQAPRPSGPESQTHHHSARHAESRAARSSPDQVKWSYAVAREETRLILEGETQRLKGLRRHEAERRREQTKDTESEHRHESRPCPSDRTTTPGGVHEGGRETHRAAHRRVSQDHTDPESAAPPTEATTVGRMKSKLRTLVIGGPAPPAPPARPRPPPHSEATGPHEQSSGREQPHRREQPQDRDQKGRDLDRTPPPPPSAPAAYDGPRSAVNAGERHVHVEIQDRRVSVAVMPTTTCEGLLQSASSSVPGVVDLSAAVVAEVFSQLGLERPIRRYERIRDVMNSWDSDTQNTLLVHLTGHEASDTLSADRGLAKQPPGLTVQMYHSSRPGKWEKQWLRLRDDGQITRSKEESGLDATNICHLSDCDVYRLVPKQLKRIRPPKRFCMALKSQEKASIFLDAVNFVHFFCTKDQAAADRWYHAIHAWRGWYLLTMLGRAPSKPAPPVRGSMDRPPTTHRSQKSLPYVLGSFKPLLEFGRAPSCTEELGSSESDQLPRSSHSGVARPLVNGSPGQRHSTDRSGSRQASSTPTSQPPLAGGSAKRTLLDSAYAEKVDGAAQGPFTGNGLLARSASRRSHGASRSGRGVPGADGKPLVDLQIVSEFTDGSLLRKMEGLAGHDRGAHPHIDRRKREEIDVSVGEGLD